MLIEFSLRVVAVGSLYHLFHSRYLLIQKKTEVARALLCRQPAVVLQAKPDENICQSGTVYRCVYRNQGSGTVYRCAVDVARPPGLFRV